MSLLCYLKSRLTVDGVIPTMPFCTTNQRPIYNHDLVKMWSFNFHKLKSGHCSDLLATSASFKLRDEILMILKPTKLVFSFSLSFYQCTCAVKLTNIFLSVSRYLLLLLRPKPLQARFVSVIQASKCDWLRRMYLPIYLHRKVVK